MMQARKVVVRNGDEARLACRVPATPLHADLLRRALHWIVRDDIFTNVPRHDNTSWAPGDLVVLAVLWVWSSCAKLTDAFGEAQRLSQQMLGRAAVGSYQGLSQALVRHTEQVMPLLWKRLRVLMQHSGRSYWRIGPWLPLAVDGSRVTTPRTKSNERALAAARYGQGAKARSRRKWKNKRRRSKPLGQPVKPQIWLTLLWHMGLKMPWAWRCGPSTASERDHLLELLEQQKFPGNTLFCGDAGFVGYRLWKAILDGGQNFLIRVGANVRFLRELGQVRQRQGLVYFWPRSVARQGQPPMVLRLLEFQTKRGRIYLVTNILSQRALTNAQAVQLHRLRWGVELQFRSLKQTFDRGKLRSRTPQRALAELEWSLVGLWMIQLLAIQEQLAIDQPPERSSVALALAVIQNAIRCWSQPATSPRVLKNGLRAAIKDSYHRQAPKQGRYRPPIKDIPTTGKPAVLLATQKLRDAYRTLKNLAA
jgi:hypothetical protein